MRCLNVKYLHGTWYKLDMMAWCLTAICRVFCKLGVDAGDTIRVPSAGNSGAWGSASGDLFIKLKAIPFRSSILYLKF